MNDYKCLTGGDLITGRLWTAGSRAGAPLVVLIHGGGCNGRYFELKGASTVEAVRARGFPVLVLDRPGYGANRMPGTDRPVIDTAPAIRDFIADAAAAVDLQAGGVALVGHSIGGAIAVTIAADPGKLPLKALAISGIGDASPDAIRTLRLPHGLLRVPAPSELTERLFFDPERTLGWRAVASLRAAAEDWLVSEVKEVVERWPSDWRLSAERVAVPVHLRLAEYERVWETGPEIVARMAGAFTRAPLVDAALLRGGGHLYEATVHGRAFVDSQLDFIAGATGPI